MTWFQWRRRAGPTGMIPAMAAPVAHVVGPGRLTADAGRLVHENAAGERQATLLFEGLELVTCLGPVEIDPRCLAALAEAGVAVALLSADGGRFLARITPEGDPRVMTRVLQHRVLADPAVRIGIASRIVAEKIHGQAASARHYQRQGRGVSGELMKRLADLEARAREAATLDELLGLEGAASAAWYEVFAKLLRQPWTFARRSRRPPLDPVNAALSLGYTLLYHRLIAACQAAGLEAGLGALHAYRAGRQSLACDLMEPLRAPLVDRWVVSLLNQGRVAPEDFLAADDGGVRLTKKAFPRVLADWERAWHETRSGTLVAERVRAFGQLLRERSDAFPRVRRELEDAGVESLG